MNRSIDWSKLKPPPISEEPLDAICIFESSHVDAPLILFMHGCKYGYWCHADVHSAGGHSPASIYTKCFGNGLHIFSYYFHKWRLNASHLIVIVLVFVIVSARHSLLEASRLPFHKTAATVTTTAATAATLCCKLHLLPLWWWVTPRPLMLHPTNIRPLYQQVFLEKATAELISFFYKNKNFRNTMRHIIKKKANWRPKFSCGLFFPFSFLRPNPNV